MKFWFSLIQVTELNDGYLNAIILVYFSITVYTFLSLRACICCYFFTCMYFMLFLSIMFSSCLWLVYNGLEFIFLCSGRWFRHSPNVSSKVGVEFIHAVLYIDGLSSFFIFHQTQNILTVIKVISCSCKRFLRKPLCFLGIRDSIDRYVFTLFQPPIFDIHYVTIRMALLYICERSLSGNGQSNSLS